MKLNLNQSVAALDGTEIPQSNLADLLASSLCGKTPGIESVKAMDWALSLKNNKEIEIDRTDLKKLESLIKTLDYNHLTNIIISSFLRRIEDCSK